jgi:predicted permease
MGTGYRNPCAFSGFEGAPFVNFIRRSLARLRNLFRGEQLDRELGEELTSHLEMHIADNLRAGMTAEEARRVALIQLGGIAQTKENVRDHRSFSWLENLLRDTRFGLRVLGKDPGFTAVAVLTLALGIGANTAIFSVVNSVLLRSLPFPRTSELVDISARSTAFDFSYLGLSLPDIADMRASASSFSAIAIYKDAPKELSGDGKPERIESSEVSEEFFRAVGIAPLLGRIFTPPDMKAGGQVAVLGYDVWRGRFGGDPAAIGKRITLDGRPYTIIGVMPSLPKVGFVSDSQLWTPFVPTAEQSAARDNHAYSVVAHLKTGTSIAHAQNELDTIAARLASVYPDVDKGWTIHATSLKELLLGDARAPLAILFCAVGFVLLIACANVSNLFLSRGWARRREFAIRSALGATRGALLRQLGVESLLVALAGGACALLVVQWTLKWLGAVLPPDIPRLQDLRMESAVGWFTLGASLLAAGLTGLAPALLSSRQNVSDVIKTSNAGAGMNGFGVSHNLLRQFLVVSEVALAVVLVIGATLAVRSFERLRRLDLGFRPDHMVILRMDFPKFRYATSEQAVAFVRQILDESRGIQGVETASAGLVFPLSDEVAETTFQTEASAADAKADGQTALTNGVAPEYFQTLGVPLIAGHDFNDTDAKGQPLVFVVNEALARKYFGSIDVIGKRISTRQEAGHPIWGQVVGVSGNIRETTPETAPKPLIYSPLFQMRESNGVYLVVRAKREPMAIVPAIEERIWSIDKNQPITGIKTIETRIAEVDAAPRSQSFLLGMFGGLGFVLALVGVYGVMSYMVSLQTREIGIRMALGADPGEILRMVMAHGLKLTIIGVSAGVATGLILTRFMRSLLFGISTNDPVTFAGVAAFLSLVALAACFIPARRATRVDPMVALRYE